MKETQTFRELTYTMRPQDPHGDGTGCESRPRARWGYPDSTPQAIADIFRGHGPAWREANRGHVSLGQLKVMSAIESCRTAALGGHVARCEDCARQAASRAIGRPHLSSQSGSTPHDRSHNLPHHRTRLTPAID